MGPRKDKREVREVDPPPPAPAMVSRLWNRPKPVGCHSERARRLAAPRPVPPACRWLLRAQAETVDWSPRAESVARRSPQVQAEEPRSVRRWRRARSPLTPGPAPG